MKKLIISVFIIILSFLLSCGDVIDIGEVHKTPINGEEEPPPPPIEDNRFAPDSVYVNLQEVYLSGNTTNNFVWGPSIKFNRKEFKLDTSDGITSIWIDLEIESNKPDDAMPNRADRLKSFKIKLDSINVSQGLFEMDSKNEDNWSAITIKDLDNNSTYYFTDKDYDFGFYLQYESDTVISGGCLINIQRTGSFETQFIEAVFNIYM